ncbi:hypothetical protein [Sphaerisporangium dianthi]|uniref:Uncharacterized protein n=1 Tax=Sphaerisporangium dianthi TaxID=1436120 RepID=A0ABV9CJ43_9ACTN
MLNRRFEGWSVWFGGATGRWWALAPRWGRGVVGLVEAGSAEELVLRINQVELAYPPAGRHPFAGPPEPVDRRGPPPGEAAR